MAALIQKARNPNGCAPLFRRAAIGRLHDLGIARPRTWLLDRLEWRAFNTAFIALTPMSLILETLLCALVFVAIVAAVTCL